MITPKNLAKHELIGLEAEVMDTRNKKQIGIKGKVVDETKNMLVIFDKGGNKDNDNKKEGNGKGGIDGKGGMEKRIEKKSAKFAFEVAGKKIVVDGKLLAARPEDRIKKRLKKW